MEKIHDIEELTFINDQMRIKIDGKEHIFPLNKISKRLLKASPKEKEKYEISPSGYGIHWPLIDEDLSVDSLLGLKHKSSFEELSRK